MSRLLAAVSPHGFGHLAQAATVLNALWRKRPDIERVVRTAVPEAVVRERIEGDFRYCHAADDFGMAQHSALAVDVAASAARYRAAHTDWRGRVAATARELEQLAPDGVLADVPYLTLAGAAEAGIPALAMCCLNWADIYGHYCADLPESGPILAQMQAAYGSAHAFLRTEPAMPMSWLPNARDIGPIMAPGQNRRAAIDAAHGTAGLQLVLVAWGGLHLRLPLAQWPASPAVRYIVPREWRVERADCLTMEAIALPFTDLVASVDLLITKPGYGSFTEAAGSGVPVLYVPRDDWPESPYLEAWLQQQGRCRRVSAEALSAGRFQEPLEALLAAGRHRPVKASGVAGAVEAIEALVS